MALSTVCRGLLGAALVLGVASQVSAEDRGFQVDIEAIPASDPIILQWFEGSWQTMYRRMGDAFAAGYTGMWVPPPGRGSGDGDFIGQIGYDLFNRFDFGQKQPLGTSTRYGDNSQLTRFINQADRARIATYYDSVMNHNGSGTHANQSFVDAGGYPGFAMSYSGDNYGDFHPPSDNSDEFTMYLAGLIDIAQEKNHVFVRQPAVSGPNDVPGAGVKPNQPIDWYHRRFYPDLDPAPGDVLTPSGFNLTNPLGGDPVAENATGYLLRYSQYMNEVMRFDGIRVDAIKHIPQWYFNNLWDGVLANRGKPLLDGTQTTPFSFGESFTGDVGALLSYHNRTYPNNRTVLDFNHYFTINGIFNGGGFGNLQDAIYSNIDNENNNRFDGSAGVYFIASHDKEGGGGSNVGNFWVTMRKGHANIYHKAGEFPPVQVEGNVIDFPKSGGSRGDALGAFPPDNLGGSSIIADMVDIRRTFARGPWRERWLDGDFLVMEYEGRLLYGLSDRGDDGTHSATVLTGFPQGTVLEELTANAVRYNTRTGTTDIPETITVGANGSVTIVIPRNAAQFGYVAYAPVTPDFTWDLTNVAEVIAPDSEMTPVATRRLTSVRRIISASSTLSVTTDGTEYTVLANIGNHDINENGSIDYLRGGLAGFEHANSQTTNTYNFNIDWTQLGDGYHFVEVVAVKGGGPGQHAAVWSSQRFTVFVDLNDPEGHFASPAQNTVISGGENLHVQFLTDGTEDNALINVSTTYDPARPTNEFGQMRSLGPNYWGLTVQPSSGDRVITVRLFEETGNSKDFTLNLIGQGEATPTPSPTPTPAPTATPSPTPSSGSNPFVMDGVLDGGTCQVGDLYMRELNGWLYIATNSVTTNDAFIYASSDPSVLKAANWAKSGQVGTWDLFLGAESTNDFAGWFNNDGTFVGDLETDQVSARNGSFMEGAIRKSLVGGTTSYVALGLFQTDNAGALVDQSPDSTNADANIDAGEFLAVESGVDPCGSITPTVTPTISPTPTITPTVTPTTTATTTPTPTPTPAPRGITIGPGTVPIGETSGRTYYEEFQDWQHEDCNALDDHSVDTYLLANEDDDGFNDSRDLLAFYTFDDPAMGKFYMRADVMNLIYNGMLGAVDMTGLDLIIMLDFGSPSTGQVFVPNFADATTDYQWEVALVLKAMDEVEIWDSSFTPISASSFEVYSNGDLDSFEMGIDRSLLTAQGWDGSSPINIQVATMVDTGTTELPGFASKLVDTLPSLGDPVNDDVLTEAFTTSGTCGRAKFSYILHGNQAISGADYIQQLIYNDVVITPNGNPTGYHRALDTARIFKAPPTIHVSATLISSMLWAKTPLSSNPQDGPTFVQKIKSFVDGTASVAGHITSGVYSEHIMPYFEGDPNQWSIALNEVYLNEVFGLTYPHSNTMFWVPERVIQGTTFADIVTAGYNWIILDEDEHLKTWFPAEHPDHIHEIHRINGMNVVWISEEQDYFKFANSDGGLWQDMRGHFLDYANDTNQEQYTLVFDDWEAYAGRSFLSFNQGTDNPDNWNTNIRWIANHPWIQVCSLDEIADAGWTPRDMGTDTGLPVRSYDFLQHATEGSYHNWYFGRANDGLAAEEDYDDYQPFIRTDLNQRSPKVFGQMFTWGGPGPRGITNDVYNEVDNLPTNVLSELARLSYSTGTYETAWHDEDQATRCMDRTFCIPDTTDDLISDWQKRITFNNLRRTGFIAHASRWGTLPSFRGGGPVQALDLDHDGENEYVLYNNHVMAIFENDGGRLIASFARDPMSANGWSMTGNLLGFPDFEDEQEANAQGGSRTSSFTDWWAEGATPANKYVNDVYTVSTGVDSLTFTSSDGLISKSFTLPGDATTIQATYTVDPSITSLYVRHGLAPDIASILTGGQAILNISSSATQVAVENTASGVSSIAVAGDAAFTQFSDGTQNSPRNQPLLHVVELEGSGSFATSLLFDIPGVAPTPTVTPTATPTATATLTPTATATATPTFTPTATTTPTPGTPLATPGGPDSDGDGFSDAIETALGSGVNDSNSTPDFGDRNGDGNVDVLDALQLYRELAGTVLQPYQAILDINGDGYVDNTDGELLLRWCFGWTSQIPAS